MFLIETVKSGSGGNREPAFLQVSSAFSSVPTDE